MDIFANYPHLDPLFARLQKYDVHIEELYLRFKGTMPYPESEVPVGLRFSPSCEYGDPRDAAYWSIRALVYIRWPRTRRGDPVVPANWKRAKYQKHREIAPINFMVYSYSRKDGIEALYQMLSGMANDLEQFDEQYGVH